MAFRVVAHSSARERGGAERSLLAALLKDFPREDILYLLPGDGAQAERLRREGIAFHFLPWPACLEGRSRLSGSFLSFLASAGLGLPDLLRYLHRLWTSVPPGALFVSSGLRSHLLSLPLLYVSFLTGRRSPVLFDIRDFIRPVRLRRLLAFAIRTGGGRVRVNSRAVGRDFPGAEVVYPLGVGDPPEVRMAPGGKEDGAAAPRLRKSRPWRLTHLAYFAPYKGQERFLRLALRLKEAGVPALFRLAGDVIYDAESYHRYREGLRRCRREWGLEEKVEFLGALGEEEVARLLRETDILVHCTEEPEPFGRVLLEALRAGCRVVCHEGSGACELLEVLPQMGPDLAFLRRELPPCYVEVVLPRDGGKGLTRV